MISENALNYENVVIRKEQEIGINNFGLDYLVSLEKEIERLKNIIKEVRKYIEENTNSASPIELTSGKITDIGYCIVAFEDILEILDKGE